MNIHFLCAIATFALLPSLGGCADDKTLLIVAHVDNFSEVIKEWQDLGENRTYDLELYAPVTNFECKLLSHATVTLKVPIVDELDFRDLRHAFDVTIDGFSKYGFVISLDRYDTKGANLRGHGELLGISEYPTVVFTKENPVFSSLDELGDFRLLPSTVK